MPPGCRVARHEWIKDYSFPHGDFPHIAVLWEAELKDKDAVLFKTFYFHGKIESTESSQILPTPIHAECLLSLTLQFQNLIDHIITMQHPSFTLGLTLSFVLSVGLDKQPHNDLSPPLHHHTEHFHCSRNPGSVCSSSRPQTLATTDHFTASTISFSLECPAVGIMQ